MAIGSSSQSAITVSGSHTASNSVGSNHKAPLLHPSEYDQWVDRMEDYLYALDADLWRSVTEGPVVVGVAARLGGTAAEVETNTTEERRRANNDRRAIRELRYGLPPSVYTRVQSCKSAMEIWNKLKDLYEGTDKRKKGQMKAVITQFSAFAQEDEESLEDCFTRYSILVDQLIKFNIHKTQIELNVIFLQSLRKEWKPITTMIRIHEQVDEYSLTDLFDLLKNHEKDLDMAEVTMTKGIGGPLALVSKPDMHAPEGQSDFQGLVLSDVDTTGNDMCFIVNGRRMFYNQNRHNNFTRNEWNSHKESKNWKDGWTNPRTSGGAQYEKNTRSHSLLGFSRLFDVSHQNPVPLTTLLLLPFLAIP